MLRGEIWLINLDPTIGAEIRTSYLLSAKGAFSYQPGYHPRGAIIFSTSAESATQCAVPPSIPHIALVELHTVSAQQLSARTITRRRSSLARPARSTNGLRGWALNISTASWVARPTSGRPSYS